TASEAHLALEDVLKRERVYAPASSALKAFLHRYDAAYPTDGQAKSDRSAEQRVGGTATKSHPNPTSSSPRRHGRTQPPARRLTPEEEQAEEIRALEAELARLAALEEAEAAASTANPSVAHVQSAPLEREETPAFIASDGHSAAEVVPAPARRSEAAAFDQKYEDDLLAELDLALDAAPVLAEPIAEITTEPPPPQEPLAVLVEPEDVLVECHATSDSATAPIEERPAEQDVHEPPAFETEIVSVGYEMPALDVAALPDESTSVIMAREAPTRDDESDDELRELEQLLADIRQAESQKDEPVALPPVDEYSGPLWGLTVPIWHVDRSENECDASAASSAPRCPDTLPLDFDAVVEDVPTGPIWQLTAPTFADTVEAEADENAEAEPWLRCSHTLSLNFETPVYVQALVAAGAATPGLIAEPTSVPKSDIVRLQLFSAADPPTVVPFRRAASRRVSRRLGRRHALPERTSPSVPLAVRRPQILEVVADSNVPDREKPALRLVPATARRRAQAARPALAEFATPVEARLSGPVRATLFQTLAASAARGSVLRLASAASHVPGVSLAPEPPILDIEPVRVQPEAVFIGAAAPVLDIIADAIDRDGPAVAVTACEAEPEPLDPHDADNETVATLSASPVLRLVPPAEARVEASFDGLSAHEPISDKAVRGARATLPPSVQAELERLLAKFGASDDRVSQPADWTVPEPAASMPSAVVEAAVPPVVEAMAPPIVEVPAIDDESADDGLAEALEPSASPATQMGREDALDANESEASDGVPQAESIAPSELVAEVDPELAEIEALLREAEEADRLADRAGLETLSLALTNPIVASDDSSSAVVSDPSREPVLELLDHDPPAPLVVEEVLFDEAPTDKPKARGRKRGAKKRSRTRPLSQPPAPVAMPTPTPSWQVPEVGRTATAEVLVATAEDVAILPSQIDRAPLRVVAPATMAPSEPGATSEPLAVRSMAEAPIRYEPWRAIPLSESTVSAPAAATRPVQPKPPDPWNVETEAAKEAQVVPFTPKPAEWSSSIRLEDEDIELQLQRNLSARSAIAEPEEDAGVEKRPTARRSWRVDWKRTAAASLAVMLLEGVAFATAYWIVKPAENGTLLVETSQAGVDVLIDGRASGRTPLTAELKPGRHTLELRGFGSTKVVPVEISAGVQTTQSMKWPRAGRLGKLMVSTTPAGARVFLDGVVKGTAPLTIDDVAAGSHVVMAESPNGTVKNQVRVAAGESLDVELGIFSGWVTVFSPVEVRVFESGRLLGTSLDGKLLIAAGTHTIELVNKSLGYRERRTVDIEPGKESVLSIEAPNGSVIIEAPDGTEILIDGQPAGMTPVDKVSAAIGTREVVLRHPTLGQRRMTVTVGVDVPARVSLLAPQ
ncbi:MAG: PEGA domain-containing protein, partial [Vicinamibacterales bacterium]